MNPTVLFGATLAILGGALQGAFALPMKYARKWNHENIWFVFVLVGLVIFPWLLTIIAVPSPAEVYRATPWQSLALIAACGIGWGIGVTLVGVAFRMLGIGLGFAIVLGLSALLGSLAPFLVQSREGISTASGRFYLLGTALCSGASRSYRPPAPCASAPAAGKAPRTGPPANTSRRACWLRSPRESSPHY
jgi:L-rhamnose-H+ transport protein